MTVLAPITTMQWEEVGAWPGGTVVGVALEGRGSGRGLLASRAGVYRWSKPGTSIEPLVTGLSDLHVVAMAFAGGDGTNPAKALAATVTGRLFRLVSPQPEQAAGGEKWQEIKSWAGLGVAVVLEPSPAFAQDQTLFVGTPSGIYRTLDDGQSWESCNFGLQDEEVLCLACAPDFAESELMWAGTAGGGLYRSRNRARAWRDSGYGLPDAAVQSIAVSPNFADDRTLFAGLEEHGVYVSRDGGENWESLGLASYSVNTLSCGRGDVLWAGTDDGLWRMDTATGEAIAATGRNEVVLSVAANADGEVAAGLFGAGLLLAQDDLSETQGDGWQMPVLPVHAPPVIAVAGDSFFALDSDGYLARSHDGGVEWQELESASDEGVFALDAAVVVPQSEGEVGDIHLYAATATGLSRWDRSQETWQEVANEPFPHQAELTVSLSPNFAGDESMFVAVQDGWIMLSQDRGVSWRSITGPWTGQMLLRAHFAPSNASELIALTVQPSDSGHFAVTVWHTTDCGQIWEVLANFTTGVAVVMMAWPADPAEHALFMATQHRVLKLYTQGDPSALQVHQHFFDEALRVTVLAPASDFAESGIIWAATTGGLYRSVDRGMSWGLMVELPLGLPLVWLEVTTTHLRAITLGGRIWRALL